MELMIQINTINTRNEMDVTNIMIVKNTIMNVGNTKEFTNIMPVSKMRNVKITKSNSFGYKS